MSASRTRGYPDVRSAKTARARAMRLRRKRWYALIVSSCVLAGIVCLGMTANFSGLFHSDALLERSMPTPGSEGTRVGTIILRPDSDRCEQMKVDNDSGRNLEEAKPCDNKVILDAHGKPMPMGTVHRLDAISRSFFRH